MLISDFDFCRKNPVERISFSSSGVSAAASARGVGITREQRRRDEVDARIGRLCRQDRRHQQLKGIAVNELRIGIRMMPIERVEDSRDD